jgi:hypothetical protein
VRSRRGWNAIRFVAGVVVAGATVACVPTASSAGPRVPVAGCHDSVGTGGGYDVEYSGEPSEYGNLTFWTSTDGTCSGSPVDMTVAATTLMVADGPANAEFLCLNLLATVALSGTFDERTGPWSPAFGSTGFVCAG